jgi:hypothetical protein
MLIIRLMRCFITLLFLFFSFAVASQPGKDAQKNRIDITPVRKVTLTTVQEKWLAMNYKNLSHLKKETARKVIKQQFSMVSEAELEFFISQASRMQAEEDAITGELEQLKSEKQSLVSRINNKQAEINSATDPVKKEKLRNELAQLQMQLQLVNKRINDLEEKLKKLHQE